MSEESEDPPKQAKKLLLPWVMSYLSSTTACSLHLNFVLVLIHLISIWGFNQERQGDSHFVFYLFAFFRCADVSNSYTGEKCLDNFLVSNLKMVVKIEVNEWIWFCCIANDKNRMHMYCDFFIWRTMHEHKGWVHCDVKKSQDMCIDFIICYTTKSFSVINIICILSVSSKIKLSLQMAVKVATFKNLS